MAKVRDIMHEEFVTATPRDTVRTAVELMSKTDAMGLIVVDECNSPVGIFSERSIVKRVLPQKVALDKVKVGTFMRVLPPTVEPGDDVSEAAQIMAVNNLSKLPVVERGRLKGILTLADIARQLAKPRSFSFLSKPRRVLVDEAPVCPSCNSKRLLQIQETWGPVWRCPECSYVLD